jgi:hypothetical protein
MRKFCIYKWDPRGRSATRVWVGLARSTPHAMVKAGIAHKDHFARLADEDEWMSALGLPHPLAKAVVPVQNRSMNPREFAAARAQLGWSLYEMGCALELDGEPEHMRRRVSRMERGERPISGPMSVAVRAFLAGFIPPSLSAHPRE